MEQENLASENELLKQCEKHKKSKSQNLEKQMSFGQTQTARCRRPVLIAPRGIPQDSYIPYTFDTVSNEAGNQKMLGKDEE